MRKHLLPAALAALAVPGAAWAQPCAQGVQALQVTVGGFKERTGTLRVVVFAGDENYQAGRPRVTRVEVPVTQGSGAMTVCLPVPAARDYAVTVRHDINGNGRGDRSDGGGFSNNPRITLGQAISRSSPAYERVRVQVQPGRPTQVSILLNYLQGLSIGPIRAR